MAARFWVDGTGTWDASDTTHWAASSGGAGGQSVPGSGDTVTFDGSSGGGTCTVNTTVTVQSLTWGAFTGTIDFATNNNNVTLSASGNAFSGTGTGARTFNAGSGTWTLSNAIAPVWEITTTTNLTNPTTAFADATINFSATGRTAGATFNSGGCTYGTVTFAGQTTNTVQGSIAGAPTIGTLNVSGFMHFNFAAGSTTTITTLNMNGTSSKPVLVRSSGNNAAATVAVTGATISWAALSYLTFTGSPSATNSLDLGGNSGITITVPGGSSARIIGG